MLIKNNRYTLLIISSSFSDPEKIRQILQKAEFRLFEAQSPQEAIQQIRKVHPDLILIDTDTSTKQTTPILQIFKDKRLTVPLLLATTMNKQSVFSNYLKDHTTDFIIKPFCPQELIIRIQHQLLLLQTERMIQQKNKKLQKILETRDKLYSVIAHNLRAPIGTIKMINSSVEAQKKKMKDPHIIKLFEMIHETTEDAFNLLENLLRWTRQQNGQRTADFSSFDLSEAVKQVVALFQSIASAKEIQLVNHIEGPHDICADEDMIRTVLRNLISNAIKFTYPGGQVELSLTDKNESVTVYVKDNGKGIPSDLQHRLLKNRASLTTNDLCTVKGSGWGLILCRDFIKLNHGKLNFYSQEGNGTTFFFSLPKISS